MLMKLHLQSLENICDDYKGPSFETTGIYLHHILPSVQAAESRIIANHCGFTACKALIPFNSAEKLSFEVERCQEGLSPDPSASPLEAGMLTWTSKAGPYQSSELSDSLSSPLSTNQGMQLPSN